MMEPSSQIEPGDDTIFLAPDELVSRWGGRITLKTLQNWRSIGRGPKFRRFGSVVDYRLDLVKQYEQSRIFSSSRQWRKNRGAQTTTEAGACAL